jgi:outer membrane protein TolC
VSQSTLNRANITEGDIRARFTAGTADSVDLNEVRLTVANAELAVRRSQAGRRTAELTMLVLVGMATADHINVMDSLAEPDTSAIEKSELMDNKPEILSAAAKIEQSRSLLRIARSEFFPSLSAFATYSYGKPNNDPFNSTWNNYFTVGGALSWSFNLGQKTLYNSRSAKYLVRAFINQRDDIKEQLQRQADIAWENLKLAFDKYQIAVESFQLASTNFRLGREQHRQGVLSSNRLLENESALSEIEAEMASAVVDYHMALMTYYYDIGSDKLMEGTY